MTTSGFSDYHLQVLLSQALEIFQAHLFNPTNKKFEPIASLLSEIGFFQKIFKSNSEAQEFVELARPFLDYEVHPRGTIILQEKKLASKFYVILKGDAQKLCQRAHDKIKQDFQTSKYRSSCTIDQDNFDLLFASSQAQIQAEPVQEVKSAELPSKNTSILEKINSDPAISQEDKFDSINVEFKGLSGTAVRNPKFRRGGIKGTIMTSIDFTPKSKATTSIPICLLPSEEGIPRNFPGNASPIQKDSEEPIFVQTGIDKLKDEPEVLSIEDKDMEDKDLSKEDMTEEHLEFIKELAAKYPDMSRRFMLGDTVCLINSKTYQAGDFFGENFYKQPQPRENSMVVASSEEIHLLTLSRDSYKLILSKLFKQSIEKADLFAALFPLFDKETTTKFSEYFIKKRFKIGETIYNQSEITEGVCLLQSGKVSLVKEVEVSPQNSAQIPASANLTSSGNIKKAEIPIATIVKGQCFGEELLLNESHRKFTALANSPDTVVYFLEASAYDEIKEKYVKFLDILRAQAQEKFSWRNQKVSSIIEQQQKKSSGKKAQTTLAIEPSRNIPLNYVQSFTVMPKETPSATLTKKNNPSIVIMTEQSPKEGSMKKKLCALTVKSPKERDTEIFRASEIYKDKFARKLRPVHQINSEAKVIMTAAKNSDVFVKNELEDLNVRKALQEPRSSKLRLPNLKMQNRSLNSDKSSMMEMYPNSPRDMVNMQSQKMRTTFLSPRTTDNTPNVGVEKAKLKKILISLNYGVRNC